MHAAQDAMIQQATELQQYAQDHQTYPTTCPNPVTPTNFLITCTGSQTAYLITATGSGPATGLAFTLDNLGNKTTTSSLQGWTGNTTCWTRDQAGDCAIQ